MKIALFAFILFTITSHACDVEFFSKIYRFNTNQVLNTKQIIKRTDCTEDITLKLVQFISSSNGVVSNQLIERELKNIPLNISPNKISISDLGGLLKENLSPSSNLYFLDIRSLNNQSNISLSENETLRVSCEACNSVGEKNVKIEINNPVANTTQTQWITSKLFSKVKTFKAKRTLSFQQRTLSPDDFYEEDLYTFLPDNVLSSLENIKFYKPNKTILEGSVVSTLDLQPVNLVNFGTPAKVEFKGSSISLTRMAIPSRTAQFGEIIQLKNPSNNKMITGKVVDFNHVVIEL